MFNPFERFEPRFIDVFRAKKKRYLVSQTYKNGDDHFDQPNKTYLLLSHYADLNKAQVHKKVLAHDPFAAILDLEKTIHIEKLQAMLAPDSKYIIFSILITNTEHLRERIMKRFSDNIRRYISKKTNWRIGGDQELKTQYDITFGDLYIILKYGSKQPIRIKFEEIENS